MCSICLILLIEISNDRKMMWNCCFGHTFSKVAKVSDYSDEKSDLFTLLWNCNCISCVYS